MIAAVVFDLYETLVTEANIRPTRASSLAPVLGLDDKAYRVEWRARRPSIVLGKLAFADALAEISERLSGSADRNTIQQICEQRVREKEVVFGAVRNEISGMISELARHGIRLGVISNGFREDVMPWANCTLAPAFQCAIFSCELGVAKPSPEIYRNALDRMGVSPDETVYIGDGGDNELAGAEAAGLRAFRAAWFVPKSPPGNVWPELIGHEDVLNLVTKLETGK